MLEAFLRAVKQLGEPGLLGPLCRTLLWTFALFALVGIAAYYELRSISIDLGEYQPYLMGVGVLAGLLVLWFGFAVVENAVVFCHADSIVRAVEARYYPLLPPVPGARWVDLAWSGARLLLQTTLANLAALPVYLVVPGANLFLFVTVNGYFLGRAYFDAVALRRLDDRSARALWRAGRGGFVLDGMISTALFAVPVINLVVPVVGLAAAVHLFERRGGAH